MSTTAILIIDIQQGVTPMMQDIDAEGYLSGVATAAQQARTAGIQVIHIKTTFRPGYLDLCPKNKILSPIITQGKTTNLLIDGHTSSEFEPVVAPKPGSHDLVVTKKRTSAFVGSDLELLLRNLHIDKLVVAGIATSGAVLSTVRQASDMDFLIIVLEDLCLDRNPEVQRILMETIFPSQATVVSSNEWIASLSREE